MPVMNVMTGVRAQLIVNRQASVDYVLRYFAGLSKLSIIDWQNFEETNKNIIF